MVDNQHKQIKGCRDLSQEEIDLMNKIKEVELEVGALWRLVNGLDSTDKRWAAIAKTDLQTGFMALVRSVANPESAFDF
jgi:hypothetical protein